MPLTRGLPRILGRTLIGAVIAFLGLCGSLVLEPLTDRLSQLGGWNPQYDYEPACRVPVYVAARLLGLVLAFGLFARSRQAEGWRGHKEFVNPVSLGVAYAGFVAAFPRHQIWLPATVLVLLGWAPVLIAMTLSRPASSG